MIRLFQPHHIRTFTELEGLWDFTLVDPQGNEDKSRVYRLPVPGCWEAHPELADYQGKGMYRRTIALADKQTLRFVFKGVSHTADVYFDGKPVARHYNAYTAFDAVVADAEPGEHELAVLVDNGFHEGSSLHIPNDYYTYGGLIRPVVVEELGAGLFIDRIAFTPYRDDRGWRAAISAVVRNASAAEQTAEAVGELAGRRFALGAVRLRPGAEATVACDSAFPDVREWSAESPQLYLLQVRLTEPGTGVDRDDLIERVGFRTVTALNGRIQVNGKDIVLKGFNRHEDHPMVGPSFPLSLMVQDLDLMADMGCNSVRTSHYPNDERFLDLCDERGFYVWEENHARGLNLERMRHPLFVEQCANVNREMVEQHRNHPSIIIWAILNECASDTEEGRAHYERQLGQIRAMDGSRPLTFASHNRDRELCFDLADIVSFNLYPGWYGTEDPGELADRARGWADARGGEGKPMIMSEFGGDGFYGYRSPLKVKGTEERQAQIIGANLAAYQACGYISGMFIWQFCDCRVNEETSWPITRVQTMNNKGVVDAYRRPKLAYETVRRHFRGGQ